MERRRFEAENPIFSAKFVHIDKFHEMGIELHLIIGNHDTYYKNTNEVNSMDELVGSDKCNIYTKPQVVEFDGCPIQFMHWINAGNYDESMSALKNSPSQILMGHLEVNGFEMHKGHKSEGGWDKEMFRRFDLCFSGHFHHKSDNGNVYYLGNPYEITWSDYNDKRGFHIYDTETMETEFIENPHSMFHKIYYNDEKNDYGDLSKYEDTYVKIIIENNLGI